MSANEKITPYNKMGCAIRHYRKKIYPMQGGQAEFAKAIGVTRQELSAWENGKRNPNLNNLRKIAKALQVTVDELRRYDSSNAPEQNDNQEYWRDLAVAYKSRIKELEAEVKNLKSEVRRLKTPNI